MKREDENRLEDQFESWVSAYHEALADGSATTPPQEVPPPELLPRVQRAQACLQLLERVWPRSQPAPPVDLPENLPAAISSPPGPPTQVGRFHILRELGRGGFGIVFLAEDPTLGRQVALKVPRGETLLDADLRKRFVWEAETAAKLSHAHIVPVLEAGEAGAILYIATEYCPGTTLAEWLEQRQQPAPPRSAATLMATLAEAVHYIHSRGILHRDLKPRNILLTTRAEGSSSGPSDVRQDLERFLPKVTDFGLAKVLERDGGDTKSGTAVGTPRYMAPEQVRGRLKEIGWHTDVYALGVILYELLTGRPPFQGDSDQDTGEQILSQEPVPPSRLGVKVPRDLETVCLKCLQKEPGKRYGSARDLADDLRRFLNGEPIRARPVGWVERLGRWCRRNPVVAILLSIVALLVILSGTGSVAAVARIIDARNRAAALAVAEAEAREKAERNLRAALVVADEYFTQLSDSPELKEHAVEQLRRNLLRKAVQIYQQFLAEWGEIRELRDQLANVYHRLGAIEFEVGSKPEAIQHLREAQSLYEQLAGEQPDVAGHQIGLVKTYLALGSFLKQMGKVDQARRVLHQALDLVEALLHQAPRTPRYREDQGSCHDGLALVCRQLKDTQAAEYHYLQAIAIRERLIQDHPAVPEYKSQLATCYNNLANFRRYTRSLADAEEYYRKALRRQEQLRDENPHSIRIRFELARTYYNLGQVVMLSRREAEAEEWYKRALDIQVKNLQAHPTVHEYQYAVANSQGSLGQIYHQTQRPRHAEAAFREALALHERLVQDNPDIVGYVQDLATTYAFLGQLAEDGGQSSAALNWYDQAIATYEKVLRLQASHQLARGFLSEIREWRAVVLARLGRYGEALQEMVPRSQAARGDSLYHIACVYSLSSAAVRKDTRLPEAERGKLAEQYVGRALALLTRGHTAGYFQDPAQLDHLRKDTDLDPLRSRPDFQKLLRELAEKAKAAVK
jgi:tetratricopeptide (TPR) repeat protein